MSQDETRNATGYAPVGYPHPQYPPPPPPQQQAYGYPAYPGYPNPYNPSAPPPGTPYYASPQIPVMDPESNGGYSCARVALVFMTTFIIGSLALSVFMGLVFGGGAPEFKIEAFSVPYFNVMTDNSTLKATWDANILAKNPSRKLEFLLAKIEGSLVYGGSMVDLTLIDPLHLGKNGEGRMQANFSVHGADVGDASGPPEWVVRQMEEDRKSGSAEFNLRIAMEATFSSVNTLWRRKNVIRVNCAGIRVNFPSPTGGGTWDGASGECVTFA